MKTIEKANLIPFCLVTLLFFLWGIAANMTDTLLSAFKKIMSMSDMQTSLIQFAFYGSYFCFALPAALYIRKHSYKSGVILGLILYSTGAILFLPAAKAASYAFYLIAIYIMAGGCSILETTANPYILSMGDPSTATRRLNIAQSFNPLGAITGILMSKYFILQDISLYSVSGTYMTLGLVLLGIMVLMLFVNMPVSGDSSLSCSISSILKRLLKNRNYSFGVLAQFFYMGSQVGVWSFTIRLVMSELSMNESEASTIYLISIIFFSAARFLFTYLMKWYRPVNLLAICAGISVLLSAVVVIEHGWVCIGALVLISFFMSLMFPTIYATALEGVGRADMGGHPDDAKLGASGLIMAILGGAVLSPLQGAMSDMFGINFSFIAPAFFFAMVMLYALYVSKTSKA